MSGDAVVYLLWAPAGEQPVRAFIDSYRTHPAGAEHRLVVALCGTVFDGDASAARRWLEGVDCEIERFEGDRIDLRTYRELIDRRGEDRFYFFNSYCEILGDEWLGMWKALLERPDVGLVGPAGSYESFVRGWTWLPRPWRLLRFARYPSPHIRTSCFAVARSTVQRIEWPSVMKKEDAWAFESGRRSLTAQVQALGLEAMVIGCDGKGYPPSQWHESATFRAGGQHNLLIADKRTHDYDEADEKRREFLARLAWGKYDGVQ